MSEAGEQTIGITHMLENRVRDDDIDASVREVVQGDDAFDPVFCIAEKARAQTAIGCGVELRVGFVSIQTPVNPATLAA